MKDLYTNGTMATLPNPAGSSEAFGSAINDNGQIAGTLYPTSGGSHTAKFSNGVWTDLGNFTGAQGQRSDSNQCLRPDRGDRNLSLNL